MILERGMLEDGRRYAVLEELSTVCPLGIRFWDAVNDAQIRDGLRVTAWPLPARRPITRAFRTISDIYAFQGLPGLIDVEMPPSAPDPVPSPPATRPFVIEVRDQARRFLPVAFRVDLPLPSHRLYLSPLPGSPSTNLPGFYLFSSPTRVREPHVAVVRTELFDQVRGEPAAWAVVRVTIAGQGDRWGLADEAGRVAVPFPLPLLTPGFGELFVSPPPGSPASPGPPVAERCWGVSIAVFSEPARLTPLAGTDLPDLAEVFQQAPADLFLSDASPLVAAADWTGTLGWDGELFAATDGRRQLRIDSHGSP